MRDRIQRFRGGTRGATAIECGFFAAGIAAAIAAAVFVLGNGVQDLFGGVAEQVRTYDGDRVLGDTVVVNEGFENVSGMGRTGWGYLGRPGDFAGWTNVNGIRPEYIRSNYLGITGGSGDYMLDLEGSPGNMAFARVLPDLEPGAPARLTFNAADPFRSNGIEVYWGGTLAASFDPQGRAMTAYSVDLVGGSGDGSNTLEIRGTGPEDNVGAAIDAIEIIR